MERLEESLHQRATLDFMEYGGDYIVIVLIDDEINRIYDFYHDIQSLPPEEERKHLRLTTMYLKNVYLHVDKFHSL